MSYLTTELERQHLIDRPLYIDRLRALRDPNLVKVLVGVRRCGKSFLLKLFAQSLLEEGLEASRIISVDYELPDADDLRDSNALLHYIDERLPTDGEALLFIDEVQELGEWARTVNGLRARYPLLDIYVTGSNQRLFAGEHLSYLAGRYVKLDVFPLSFAEFLDFAGERMPRHGTWDDLARKYGTWDDVPRGMTRESLTSALDIEGRYNDYVYTGAFPAVALAPNPILADAILEGLYDSVFQRDILLRGGADNEEAFRRVSRFLLDNIGNQTSANAIANALRSAGHKISSNTVDKYIGLLEKAYLVYRCNRFDVRGKERLKNGGKYYVVDQGLRRRVIGNADRDRGHVTENLVYLELLRRGYEVFTGMLPGGLEIDFVATKPTSFTGTPAAGTTYVQVSETVLDPATLERETRPFAHIADHYPCVLITKDAAMADLGQGITHRNLYEFLLGAEL